MLFILFLSLSANILSQATPYDQMSFWTSLKVQNLELINTGDEEFSPYLWGDYLIYVGKQSNNGLFKKNQQNYYDLKASLLKPDVTLPHFVFSNELNSKFHEGPISWNGDNNKIYFTRANSKDDEAIVDSIGRQLLQIYQADYAQGKWVDIDKLSFCSDDGNYCHPAIFNSNKKMIYASSKEEGNGKMDLYLVEKYDNGEWGESKNLGREINHEGNQWFPFILDDQHLFYASNAGDGQGLDVYYSKLNEQGMASAPQRLPFPINTSFDDFGLSFSPDGKKAFISSNRPQGKGKDDIYQVLLPGDTTTIILQDKLTLAKIEKQSLPERKTRTVSNEASSTANQKQLELTEQEISDKEVLANEISANEIPVQSEIAAKVEQQRTPEVKGQAEIKTKIEEQAQSEVQVESKSSIPKTILPSDDHCLISVQDAKANLKLAAATINMYIIPSEIATNFQYQVESSENVSLLEIMAGNVSTKKEFKANDLGQLAIKLPEQSFIYFIVKKEGYKDQGTYINSAIKISELILEMEAGSR